MLWPVVSHSALLPTEYGKLFGAEEEEVIFNVRGFESHKNYHLSLKIALSSSLKTCFGSWRTYYKDSKSSIEFHPGMQRKQEATNVYEAGQIIRT